MATIKIRNPSGQDVVYEHEGAVGLYDENGTLQDWFQPSGSLAISANGSYDVRNKASVAVNVAGGSGTSQVKRAWRGVLLRPASYTTAARVAADMALSASVTIPEGAVTDGRYVSLRAGGSAQVSSGSQMNADHTQDYGSECTITMTSTETGWKVTAKFAPAADDSRAQQIASASGPGGISYILLLEVWYHIPE